MFGKKNQDKLLQGRAVVTELKACRWFKLNARPIRACGTDDARYAHIVSLSYQINGAQYRGKRLLSPAARIPAVGQSVKILYNPNQPRRFRALFS